MADVNISKYRASVVRDGSKPATPGFVVSEGQDPVNPPGTNNYVPYTGATANVELGEYGLETGFVTLDTTPTNIPVDQGAIYWDDSRSTAALIMNGTLQHIGQDVFFYVKNSSGSSIPKGTAVRFAGTNGASGHILIEPFLANGTYPSSYFMGVTSETIANGAFGQVMHFGELTGINTSGFTAGALLYASSTVAGAFQTTAPSAPNNIILVAAAVNSKNNGAIVVRPQIGSNINTDEGVKITSPTAGQLLQLQVGGLWENKTVAQVIGTAYVPSTRTITINGTAYDLSANRSWTVGDVRTDGSYSNPSWITSLAWSKISGTPTTLSGYGITDAVPSARTITINGTTLDLSANRTFNVGTVTSVGLSSATSGVTIGSTPVTGSGTITIAIATASGSQNGLLSSTDWSTFNNKIGYTGIGGTTNYLAKFTGTTTIGISQVFDNGTNVGIGTTTDAGFKLDVNGTGRFSGQITSSSGVSMTGGWVRNMLLQSAFPVQVFESNYLGTSRFAAIGYDRTGGMSFWVNSTTVDVTSNNSVAYITNGGNVGIGTTSPLTRLMVQDSANTYVSHFSGLNQTNGIAIGTNSSNVAVIQGYTRTFSATNNIAMQVDGGNVGIGTPSPADKLHIANNGTGAYSAALWTNSNSTANLYVGVGGSAVLNTGLQNNAYIINAAASGLAFGTSDAVRMFITSGGNVGIGTTSIPNAISGTETILKISNSNVASLYLESIGNKQFANFVGASGKLVWYDISSGADRMAITSGGNVLIGTTTDSGAKLNVNGTIRTANPTGSTSDGWLLGRALVSGTSTPDRWIRVQIGNLYYDILAVYMGSV